MTGAGIDRKQSHYKSFFIWGCLSPLLLLLLIIGGIIAYHYFSGETKPAAQAPPFIKNAATKVDENFNRLEKIKPLINTESYKYDIDQTVMALYSIEKALAEAKNFDELTSFILQNDSGLAALDVAELKYRFFNIYKNILEAEDDLGEMKSVYNIASGTLLDIISSYDYLSGGLNHTQVQNVWEKRLAEAKLRDNMKKRLSDNRDAMIDFYFRFMEISSKYMREWGQLCALRDRAYLAVYEGDWNEAVKNSLSAIKLAPNEKEAHILLAMALLEKKEEIDIPQAKSIVNTLLEKQHGQNAPAYLLRGVINLKEKNFEQANIDFDQAAAYFPKQQEELTQKINLYKKRNFLNKSREGRMIINIYRGIMSGSGYFSPDFQKARVHFAQGDKDKARKKIFDHFYRRRLQGEWDRVLNDFKYSNMFLGTELFDILDGHKISLKIEPAFFTNSIVVSVKNDSDKAIHNVTALLCVRMTDMFKGDYISFPVGKTAALLKPGEELKFGRKNISELTKENLGAVRHFNDIIEYAAVLISDEIITWVEPEKVREIKPETPPDKTNSNESLSEIIGIIVNAVARNELGKNPKNLEGKTGESINTLLKTLSEKLHLNAEEKEKFIQANRQLIGELADKAVQSLAKEFKSGQLSEEKRKELIQKIQSLLEEKLKAPPSSPQP